MSESYQFACKKNTVQRSSARDAPQPLYLAERKIGA